MAIYERIAPREEASGWYKFQLRQALRFGNLAALIALAALLWPLLLSLVFPSPTAIVWLYTLAILADIGLFVTWLTLALRYNRKASAGEEFSILFPTRDR